MISFVTYDLGWMLAVEEAMTWNYLREDLGLILENLL